MPAITLRGRIKKAGGVSYKSMVKACGKKSLRNICVTAKCFLRKYALNYDDLEQELKEEGWLINEELLLDLFLSGNNQTFRRPNLYEYVENNNEEDIPIEDYQPNVPKIQSLCINSYN